MSGALELDNAQLAQFAQDGYLLVRDMFDRNVMSNIVRWTNEVDECYTSHAIHHI